MRDIDYFGHFSVELESSYLENELFEDVNMSILGNSL